MIVWKNEFTGEIKKNMRGGDGEIELKHILSADKMKHARLFANITIPVGASIGEHDHVNETEYYVINKGNGIVVDDGIEKQVAAGDVVVTGDGAKHSIRNSGKTPLEMLAIIITY
jgi:mannose-6-phosphate isomerase-like protein (cupin superfamily)